MEFKLVSKYKPQGDQPEAIAQLIEGLNDEGRHDHTLLGVTGSGKTFTIANVIAQANRPTLVMSHNKTLAAQLYGEFKNFFPENAVEYFVSYYDYYQPEAYLPATDTYIEKDLSINDDIEKMRLHTVATLLSGRRDVIVVSSVSCIYGCGNPEEFHQMAFTINVGDCYERNIFLRHLINAYYTRTELELTPATFRVRGETIDIMASFGEFGSHCFRVEFFDKEIEAIYSIDPSSGHKLNRVDSITIYPSTLFATSPERTKSAIHQIQADLIKQLEFFGSEGREIEAQRLKQRVEFDIEMIQEMGYCQGIENYSRYLDGRAAGTRPFCLIDYFPKDALTVIDESHVTMPQIRGMFSGDRARKSVLVDYGFRLPAALDNRPLKLDEFMELTTERIYVSATPAEYELKKSEGIITEQLLRPTHIIDPALELRDSEGQMDDILEEINGVIRRGEKVIVSTITKRMSEEVSRYLDRVGISNSYLHSDIDTLDRVTILNSLREDSIDVIVGVNLLREGIDLPEVSLVIIIDSDKEGFLRNERSITQISGRAARHIRGRAILYGAIVTDSLANSVLSSNRRRQIQIEYNFNNELFPAMARKSGSGLNDLVEAKSSTKFDNSLQRKSNEIETTQMAAESLSEYHTEASIEAQIAEAKSKMESAAKSLDFMDAAKYRDKMRSLQELLDKRKSLSK